MLCSEQTSNGTIISRSSAKTTMHPILENAMERTQSPAQSCTLYLINKLCACRWICRCNCWLGCELTGRTVFQYPDVFSGRILFRVALALCNKILFCCQPNIVSCALHDARHFRASASNALTALSTVMLTSGEHAYFYIANIFRVV